MEILRQAKKEKPDVPVIMVTAYGNIKEAVEAMKAGALDYILKPFDVEELKIIIAQALERGRLKKENIELKKSSRRDTISRILWGRAKG